MRHILTHTHTDTHQGTNLWPLYGLTLAGGGGGVGGGGWGGIGRGDCCIWLQSISPQSSKGQVPCLMVYWYGTTLVLKLMLRAQCKHHVSLYPPPTPESPQAEGHQPPPFLCICATLLTDLCLWLQMVTSANTGLTNAISLASFNWL